MRDRMVMWMRKDDDHGREHGVERRQVTQLRCVSAVALAVTRPTHYLHNAKLNGLSGTKR